MSVPRFLVPGALAIALGACAGHDACRVVARALCDDRAVPCERASGWLEHELAGPGHAPLGDAARDEVCRLIAGDPETLANFRDKAREDLTAPTSRPTRR